MATPGGNSNAAEQIADAFAPLTRMAASLDAQTNLLSGIHAALMGGSTPTSGAYRSATLGQIQGGPGGLQVSGQGALNGNPAQVGQTTAQNLQGQAPSAQPGFGAQGASPSGWEQYSPVRGQGPTPPPYGPGGPPSPPPGAGPGYPPAGAPSGPPGGGPGGGGAGSGQGGPPPGSPGGPGGPGGGNGGGGGGFGGGGFSGAGGSGLFNRGYNAVIQRAPLLSVPNSLRNEYQSQINKNAFYTSVAGTDNEGAFGYRIQEEMSRARYMRLFSEQEARATFKGTIANGYTSASEGRYSGRASAKEAMDFVYEGKNDYGATVEEGLGQQATMAQAATQNFALLNKQLDELSRSAGDAGVNALKARQNFDTAFNSGMAGGLAAPAAQMLAGAATEANTSLGPQFANNDSVSRMASDPGYNYMLAGRLGVTAGQITQMKNTDPVTVANAGTGMFLDQMKAYIQSVNPEGWAWLVSEVQGQGRSPGIIAEDFVSNHFGNMDPNAYVANAQAFAGDTASSLTDPLSVTRYLVKEMGGMTLGAKLHDAQKAAAPYEVKKASDVLAGGASLRDVGSLIGGGGGAPPPRQGRPGSHLSGGGSGSDLEQAYAAQKSASGTGSKAVDAMLSGMDSDLEGKQKVEVETASGKRVVSLADAIKDFSGQLQSGKARFVGGKYGGKNIGEFTGGAVDSSEETSRAAMAETKQKSSAGQAADDYYADNPDQRQGGGGWSGSRVKIDLTDRAYGVLQQVTYKEGGVEPKEKQEGGGNAFTKAVNFTANVSPGMAAVNAVGRVGKLFQ